MTGPTARPWPVHLLYDARDRYPGAWRRYDEMISRRREFGDWPPYVHVPSSLSARMVAGAGRIEPRHVEVSHLLGALAAWRPTQGMYRFDETLAAALDDTALDREIPADVMRALPEWCVWIDLPGYVGFGPEIVGYWARLDRVATGEPDELLVTCVQVDGATWSTYVPLVGSLLESLELAGARARTHDPSIAGHQPSTSSAARALAPLVSRVLYLCSARPDLRDAAGTDRAPERPTPKPRKKGKPPALAAAQSPSTWEVGYRVGAAIRRAQEAAREPERGTEHGDRRGPVPHVRRAHWHTHWVGPLESAERRRELRWHPPTLVGLENLDELVPVLRRVRG